MVKKISVFIFISLLSLFIINRIFFFKHTVLENAVSYLVSPVMTISNVVTKPIKLFFKKRHSYYDLFCYYQKLKEDNKKLLHENIKLKSMLHYNKKSKELREFESRYELKNSILAKILVKNLNSEEHSMIINRGSRDGVEKNMAAIYKFQLLGRIDKVFPTYSKIRLISDRCSNVSAYTNTSGARGIVKGTNVVNNCRLHYISHLKAVHDGDFVLSSGQGLIFPEGFCLGKIINIKTNDICHHVELEPLIDFFAIEMCHITSQSKMNLF